MISYSRSLPENFEVCEKQIENDHMFIFLTKLENEVSINVWHENFGRKLVLAIDLCYNEDDRKPRPPGEVAA